jgi:hypothetical protein
LVSHSDKPIAIVESEKTAVISSIFYPDYIWLATGGIQDLNRRIWGATSLWKEKINNIPALNRCVISNVLERIATDEDRREGLDMADYLTRK